MDKKDFEILMNSLYSNNQLFIPQGQNIKEWIDNAFIEKQEKAINYTRCSIQLKDGEVPSFAYWLRDNKYEATKDSNILTKDNKNYLRHVLFKHYRNVYNF